MAHQVLYITFGDLDNVSAGSGVRPARMYQAMLDRGYDVKMLEGVQNQRKRRRERVAEVSRWLDNHRPDFCYVELPSGPFFNHCDHKLIQKIHAMGIPMGAFYRDYYWIYPEWAWPDFPAWKKRLLIAMHRYDLRLFRKCFDVLYFPSQEAIETFPYDNGFRRTAPLPPGCGTPRPVDGTMKRRIFYVGGVRDADGIAMALEALDDINKDETKVELVLITRKEELPHLSRQDLLQRDWLTLAEGQGEELNQYYDICDLGLIPRKRHFYMDMAIAVKGLEYITNNLPILTTDVPAMSRFVKENHCGLVCEASPEGIGQAIRDYYADEAGFVSLKEATFAAAQNNSWATRVATIEADLLGEKKV